MNTKKISIILSCLLCLTMMLLFSDTDYNFGSTDSQDSSRVLANYLSVRKNALNRTFSGTPQNPVNITVEYTGAPLTAPATLTKDNFTVLLHYTDGSTQTISDYTFLSSTDLAAPGNYTITVFYCGMKASCVVEFQNPSVPKPCTITFDSNGGSFVPPITNIVPNSYISYPDTPIYYGYRFRGWYTSPDFTKEFSEDDKITSNLTLFAKWEKKENPDKDTFTKPVTAGSYPVTICADVTGQTFGQHINLEVKPLETSEIKQLCHNICSSRKYFGIALNLSDYTFSPNTPALITVSIPPAFDSSKTAVYYTSNNITIAGKIPGIITKTNPNEADTFSFYAYSSGNYIMAETNDMQLPNASDTPENSSYIIMADIGKVKQYSQVAPNVRLYQSLKNISEISLEWSSSNPSVASVSKDGVVTALSIGTAQISVRSADGTMKASKEIMVTAQRPVTSLTLNTKKKTLKKGKSFQIKSFIKPANAMIKTLTYASSNTSVAKVSKNGKITARKKGSCTITVTTTDGTCLSKKIKITVK